MNAIQSKLSERIPVEDLEFDPQNPRLPSWLIQGSQKDILSWMLDDGGIVDLMRSIGEQDYFDGEPLLVVEGSGGKYRVVEGNRRLAALKLLLEPDQLERRQKTLNDISTEATYRPELIPCNVYDARSDILNYLGYRHVTGIKSWGPLAKARYLQELSKKYKHVEEKDRYRILAKTIGSRSDFVKRTLAGLKLYDEIEEENFYGIEDLDESGFAFSLVTTALANTNIVGFLGLKDSQDLEQESLNHSHLKELTHWIFEKEDGNSRLGESRNFRDLNKVVASEVALKQFRDGRQLQEALMYTDAPAETFRTFLRNAKANLESARDQFYLIREGLQTSDNMILEDMRVLVRDMMRTLEGRLDD